MSLQRTLLLLFAAVLAIALVPAGLLIENRLEAAIEAQTRGDLSMAPALVEQRRQQIGDAMMMHAKEIASAPGLAAALAARDHAAAVRIVEAARGDYGELTVLQDTDGVMLTGPEPPQALSDETRAGAMPVAVVPSGQTLQRMALAPVMGPDGPVGVAGVSTDVGAAEAGALAGLTRADILIVLDDGSVAAATAGVADTVLLAAAIASLAVDDIVRIDGPTHRWLVAEAPLGESVHALFVRDLDRDMAVVGVLRRIGTFNLIAAVLFALLLAALFSTVLTRPVRDLAAAADRLAAGDFHAPIARPVISEVGRMAGAFETMRSALAARLEDLEDANRALADRQARLVALQAELIQRDRLAATGQLVAQLAHEIRNPVANVRNCLEVLRRRLVDDPDGIEFADLAIDELLRMHELAEQMLDLHRPRGGESEAIDIMAVARDLVALVRVGAPGSLVVTATGEEGIKAFATQDVVKQVVLNLVRNAREAMRDSGRIDLVIQRSGDFAVLEVRDDGPGIAADVLPHIFDPFYTTKGAVHGVGLGLFVAEGLIRGLGGRLTAADRPSGGARFRIELPVSPPRAASEARKGESA